METENRDESEAIANGPDPGSWRGPQPGSLLDGTYRILRPLGEGGMGLVLLARDERLDREVAIKVIRPDCPDYEGRLIDEARAMARVHHQNVVEIYAFGNYAGAAYFVMEYLPSETLDAWCARHRGPPIPPDDVLRILDPVCQGVAAIHASDTTHRDLKPSNILIGAGFRVMVADLGLAQPIAPWSGTGDRDTVSGTPEYIAPEVATQRDVAPHLRARADVYALGVIAFELLTGRLPFSSDNPVELLRMHALRQPPTPRSIRPELPAAIDDVLLHALAKDPVDRIASATAFRRALERAISPGTVEPPPPRKPSVPAGRAVVPEAQVADRGAGVHASWPPGRIARSEPPPPPAPGPAASPRLGSPELRRAAGNAASPAPAPVAHRPSPAGGTRHSSVRPGSRPLRFLVADDDEHVRGVVSRVLARTFPEAVVEAVADGTTALASLEWHTPQLALIDLDMPGMNGIEVVASLRSQRGASDMAIVVITGTGTPSDLRLLQQLGAQAFLVKPFHPSQLVATVRQILEDLEASRGESADGALRR